MSYICSANFLFSRLRSCVLFLAHTPFCRSFVAIVLPCSCSISAVLPFYDVVGEMMPCIFQRGRGGDVARGVCGHLANRLTLAPPFQGSVQALNPHAPAPSSYSALDTNVAEPGDLAFLPSRPSFCSLDRVPRRSFDSASEKAVTPPICGFWIAPPSDGFIVGVSVLVGRLIL